MAATATSAQEEFNALLSSQSSRLATHPSDRNRSPSDPDAETNTDDELADLAHEPASTDPEIPAHIAAQARPNNHKAFSSASRDRIPRARFAANTGPKGVIADAQSFREEQRLRRLGRKEAGLSAFGGSAGESERECAGWDEKADGLRKGSGNRRTKDGYIGDAEKFAEDEGDGGNDEDEEEDGDDDGFMSQWRQNRLQELQSGFVDPYSRAAKATKARRLWSGMPTVDGMGYLDAVEKSPADTVVVVYVYDDQSAVSDAIEASLRDLIPSHPRTRFVRLHFHEAEMEPAGVPALLAYKGGDMFASLVPLVDEIPDDADLDADTLAAVLRRRQILT